MSDSLVVREDRARAEATGRRERQKRSAVRSGGRRFRFDRRQFIGLSGAALIAAAARPAFTDAAQATPMPAATPVMVGGFPQPAEYVSKNGVLKTTLTVSRQTVDVAGSSVVGTVYNGSFVGPTLRVRPGDRIELDLINQLDEMTNLHYHGFHVSPSGISDNVFLMIEPGATQHYVVEIPADHPVGTYWYHSHSHPHTEAQVFGGLSGLIVIDGLIDLLPEALRGIEERSFVLKDFQAKDGAILRENIDSNAPTTRSVNGAVNPSLSLDSGETQLWRLANIGADIFYELHLDDHRFHVIAEDGDPVWQVKSFKSLVLPPAKRFDVLVRGGEPGTYELKTLAYDQGNDKYPETTLATVTVNPSSAPSALLSNDLLSLPTQMIEIGDLSAATVDKQRTVTFDQDEATMFFGIDGKPYDENRIDQRVKLDTVEEWTVVNKASEQHPFHIHINDFQVMSVNGKPYDAVGRQDTVILPSNGEVVLRMRFRDFTGKWVFHCHILNHADMGMMANVEAVA